MTSWADVKQVIADLRAEDPSPLYMYPDPSFDGHRPPFKIGLLPWAVATAERLYDRFGDQVELTVGALPYPLDHPSRRPQPPRPPDPAEPLDPAEISVQLDAPALVASGDTLRHGLLITNHTDIELAIATNGSITASVIDPETGAIVGGFAGFQNLPLIAFRVAPGETTRIPLLIGTASFSAELGYTIPPGTWSIQATLTLGAVPREPALRKRIPPLPLTVTKVR